MILNARKQLYRAVDKYVDAVGPDQVNRRLIKKLERLIINPGNDRGRLQRWSMRRQYETLLSEFEREYEKVAEGLSPNRTPNTHTSRVALRPPFNAEYLLYFLLPKEDRNIVIGDLLESYSQVSHRFNKRRADVWFYKQVICSLLPLLRRQVLRLGALVWLGRILRRLMP